MWKANLIGDEENFTSSNQIGLSFVPTYLLFGARVLQKELLAVSVEEVSTEVCYACSYWKLGMCTNVIFGLV